MWGYKISTSDGITIIINHKDGCINIRNEIKEIVGLLIKNDRSITIIEWKNPEEPICM